MEQEIIIDGMKLFYEESGPEGAPAILLMHGWGCDHTTVRSVAAVLEQKMRVINVDLPGHGKSDEPPTIWGVEEFTQLMEKFISAKKLDNISLAGHSFGGRISLLFASRNNVDKVLLIDAAGIKPRRSLNYYRKVYSYKIVKNLLLFFLGKNKGTKAVEKWRKGKGSADYQNSSPLMKGVMSKCVNEDLKSVMPDIKAPTLLVWGENDTATPISDAKTMERLIPDAGLVAFPGCGHYSFLDNPGGFKAVVKSFFNI